MKSKYMIPALFLSFTILITTTLACTCGLFPTSTSSPTPIPWENLPASAALGDTWVRPSDEMVMVYVPAGEFTMGSTDKEMDYALALCEDEWGPCHQDRFKNEQPAHQVTLDGFWIDQTEVTNAQFAAFLNEKGNQGVSYMPEGGFIRDNVPWMYVEEDEWCLIERSGDKFHPKSGYEDHPAILVSWYGAAAYCQWARAQLPTEAQWEYAARGPEGYIFPWGNEADGTRLNYCDANCASARDNEPFDDGYADTAPVGSYPNGASWVGALDMAGNAFEWVADFYEEYPSEGQENPTGPSRSDRRVVRGGVWFYYLDDARTAYRFGTSPVVWFDAFIGFRCAVSDGE